ncbi:dynamin family protein [Candidatus Moduliflexus flocculans]|uniref:Dynamin family protein n=1 Tax=Candidatus Moduliflexus flocculans TaxID=1499966 RepID=A0A081BRZ7_9BACT|nr:dynamin family protein [Candidatus Moduliflexus flocculans]
MLERYAQKKQELRQIFEQLRQLAAIRQDQRILDSLQELTQKLDENRFYLVVLGQFKRGKSTFINSLLGSALLPTAIVPLTSIVTTIGYGDEQIHVRFQNGERLAISRAELLDYVTEKGNPNNCKHVEVVEICYPSPYLKDGVYIIDTPGVGSIFADNTRVTHEFLPHVDAALFLLAGDPPISHAELEFLKQVARSVETIFFLQNKVDHLSEQDRQESLEFSKRVIEEALPQRPIQMYPISAKFALEAKLTGDERLLQQSFLPEFDRVLSEFLGKEKGEVLLRVAWQSGRKLLADERFAIQLAQKAAALPLRDLEAKIEQFDQKREEIERQKHDNDYLYDGEVQKLLDLLDRDLAELQHQKLPQLLEQLQTVGEQQTQASAEEYRRILETTLRDGIIHTFDAWLASEEQTLTREYARISRQFSARTNAIIEELLNLSSRLFDLPIQRILSEETLSVSRQLYYLLGDQPGFFDLEGAVESLSSKLLPTRLSQRRILKALLQKLPQQIDANCGRVRWDFMYRIKQSVLKFREKLNATIDTTVENIQRALQQAKSLKSVKSAEAERLLDELNAHDAWGERIEHEFERLASSLQINHVNDENT